MTARRFAWGLTRHLFLVAITAGLAAGQVEPDVRLAFDFEAGKLDVVAPPMCGVRMDLAPVLPEEPPLRLVFDVSGPTCTINGAFGPVEIPIGPDIEISGGNSVIIVGQPDTPLPLGDLKIGPQNKPKGGDIGELPVLNILLQDVRVGKVDIETKGDGHTIQVVRTTVNDKFKLKAEGADVVGAFDSEFHRGFGCTVSRGLRRVLLGSLENGLRGPQISGGTTVKIGAGNAGEIEVHDAVFDGKLNLKSGGEKTLSDTTLNGKTTISGGKGAERVRISGGSFDRLKIVLGGGDDELEIDGLSGTGSSRLKIKGGRGNEVLGLNGLGAAEVDVNLGGGDDSLSIANSNIFALSYRGASGIDAYVDNGANTIDILELKSVESP